MPTYHLTGGPGAGKTVTLMGAPVYVDWTSTQERLDWRTFGPDEALSRVSFVNSRYLRQDYVVEGGSIRHRYVHEHLVLPPGRRWVR